MRITLAKSDHPDVGCVDGSSALHGGHELRVRSAGAIGVVVQVSGGRVVDEAIVGIVSCSRACRRIEASIACREMSRTADAGKRGTIEAQRIPVGVELRQ